MNTNLIFGLLFLANGGVIPVIYYSLPAYLGLIHQRKLPLAILLLVFSVAMYIGMAYFTAVFNITWLFALYPIVLVPAAIARLSKSRLALQKSDSLKDQYKAWFWAGGLLILMLQLFPAITVSALPTYCMRQEQERITSLVSAVQNKSGSEASLQSTNKLRPACSALPGQSNRHFRIHQNEEYHFVTVRSINRYSCETYNIEQDQWYLTDTFDDPNCQ